ncbi:MAG: LysM peptidoglycan-binding domain-containing protein [Planctomycetota bacterium]|nr:LysM peptidoglycan-binding domain-containing protein [Planctomycetota bacterium]
MKMNAVRWILCIAVLIFGVIGIGKGLGPKRDSEVARAHLVLTSPVTLSWYSVDERARQWLDDLPDDPPDDPSSGTVAAANTDSEVDLRPEMGNPEGDRTPELDPQMVEGGVLRKWTIRHGDSFWKIARDVLGSLDHYQQLIEANRSIDPDRLQVGQVISLPPMGAEATVGSSPPEASREHRVATGETLATIARDYYGVADWNRLFDANRDRISNPDRLEIGTVIRIPQLRPVGEGNDR